MAQQWLNKCSRAGSKDGHFFNTVYGIWSTGLGLHDDLDLLITLITSSEVNSQVTIGTVWGGGYGIHEGRVNDLGEAK